MMNYVKSELYRVSHSIGIYCFTAVLAVLSVLLNAVLYWSKTLSYVFPFATTSFSYSNLVSNTMIFCVMAACIGAILYEGNRKNGNLKNTIAFGITRNRIFAGKCIVGLVSAVFSLVVVLGAYIGSAVLFLQPSGPVKLWDLWTEVGAVFLIAAAAMISAIVFIEAFGKSIAGIILWIAIWLIIPNIVFYLGFKYPVMHDIAMWLPDNMFSSKAMTVNMSQCITAWGTAEGMAKCVVCGVIGVVIFSAIGILSWRKKEV